MRELLLEVASIGVPGMLNACIEPVTSFAETATVGQVGGAEALAAFSPGGAFFSTAEELSAALGVAVTSAVSARGGNPGQQRRLVSTILLWALGVGLAVAVGTNALRGEVAAVLGADPTVVSKAKEYLSGRSAAIPGFIVAMSMEGSLVGGGRPWEPLKVYAVAGAANITALLALCRAGVGPLMAVAFAAVLAHGFSGLAMAWRVRRAGLFGRVDMTMEDGLRFLRLAGGVMAGAFGRVLVYNAVTAGVNRAGVAPAAAHKLAQETYWLLGCFTEPLFVAVAALVPRYLVQRPEFARRVAVVGVGAGVVIGLALLAPACLLTCTPFFTQDATVLPLLRVVAPHIAGSLLLAAVVYALEGVLVGVEDVHHLTRTHIVAALVISVTSFVASRSAGLSLTSGWALMVAYQALRLGLHSFRLGVQARPFSR